MDKKSKQKLYDAGWVFYRATYNHLEKTGEIRYSDQFGSWKKHCDGYKTMKALNDAFIMIIDIYPKAITE